jgi:hypothetical protein
MVQLDKKSQQEAAERNEEATYVEERPVDWAKRD